ncbi:MAG: CDP-alcohol phosphatidyltransferase family protein [Nanoarchaeota archaeon]|nr:CDP-alcohol phosphatidyltransferase family protein [Nanoarchaeota archaeon]
MTLYRSRDRFKQFSVKVGILFARIGLSPNQWTLISIVPIAVAFFYLISEQFLKAAVFLAIAAFIDVVDGAVARVTGRVTKLGAYLDTMVDRYIEGAVLFGLLFASLPRVYAPMEGWIFLLLFGAIVTTYAKAAAKEKDITQTEIRGGILEHTDRMIVLFVAILAAAFFGKLVLSYAIIVLAILANISALQRMWIVYTLARRKHFWNR